MLKIKLKEWRDRRALSQADLTKLSGVAQSTIVHIEHGSSARPSTVRKLAAALRVDPAELLG